MWEPFVIRALIAGIGIALIAGCVGCFVVWRQMAYFSESFAHSSILGLALGLLYGFNVNILMLIIGTIIVFLLVWLQQTRILPIDTLLGIVAHASLSIGMIVLSISNIRYDLHSFLFGDILTVNSLDLLWIYSSFAVVVVILSIYWGSLILFSIDESFAQAEGVNTALMKFILLMLIAIVVSVSIRVVGILLIASMLLIPTAAARQIVRSPRSMMAVAGILGIVATVAGILASMHFDVPSGPSIIASATAIFIVISIPAIFQSKG